MTQQEIDWIKSCLPEQMIYPYFKDKYVLDLIRHSYSEKVSIAELKQSKFNRYLNKPIVKRWLSTCGSGEIDLEKQDHVWVENTRFMRLSIGEWGEDQRWKKGNYHQVSRPELNLVLQVNFDSSHDLKFYQNIGKENRFLFGNSYHPENEKLNTLGWLRLDIDLDNGEALIEEVQSDWVKDVSEYEVKLNTKPFDPNCSCLACEKPHAVRHYVEFFNQYKRIWDELILSAGLWFLVNQLGVTNVWYHSFGSSKHYKMMPHYSLPPKSIYSKLPKKFGFNKVEEVPGLFKKCNALKKLVRKGAGMHLFQLKF